jgi:hypothetical protein
MSADTYMNVVQAIQEHVMDEVGDDTYSPHWVLILGLADLEGQQIEELIRVYRSLRTPDYVVAGLLGMVDDIIIS